jgi:hypothetical protein
MEKTFEPTFRSLFESTVQDGVMKYGLEMGTSSVFHLAGTAFDGVNMGSDLALKVDPSGTFDAEHLASLSLDSKKSPPPSPSTTPLKLPAKISNLVMAPPTDWMALQAIFYS